MKKFLKRIGLTALLLLAALAAFVEISAPRVHVAADGNIVNNPGFEEGTGVPAGWNLEKKAADKGTATLVASPAHGGQRALRLAPTARNTSTDLRDNPFGVGQGFPADSFRGKKLYFSAWLGAEGGASAVVGLYALTKQGGVISSEIKQPSQQSTKLEFHDDVLAVPNDRRIAFVVLLCLVQGTSGAAYIDDVYVSTDVPPAFGASAPASPNPPTARTATIRVDASRVVRRIPDTIYGTNIEWVWDGDGIWDASARRLNPQIVQLARDLHPSLIRFPGGTFSDFYHWRDGMGPQEQRKETQQMPGAGTSRHTFGTDEALAFAEAVGGELMITVNAGTGTAQEAADWVRYIKGSNRRVRYWEIGNELYVNDNSAQAKASTMTPDRYARLVLDFARAMRAADPSISIGAIAEENYSPSAAKAYPNWTDEVLKTAGQQIDFLAVHNGYAPALSQDKGWDARTVYSAMLAAPVLIGQSLDRIAAKIANTAPKVKIAVTEWGPYFQVTPDGRFVDHVKTLGSALYVASALQTMIRSPQVQIANAFKLVDPLFMGWIGKSGNSYLPTGPYYALQMYTRHFGSDLLDSSVQAPAYDSRAVGWADAVKGVPILDAVASRSADGRKVFLLAVNRDFDQPLSAQIVIQGFRPSAGTVWTLTGPSIDSNTGTRPFAAPGVRWAKQAVDPVTPRFEQGSASELQIREQPLTGAGEKLEFQFPPRSVVSLEMSGT